MCCVWYLLDPCVRLRKHATVLLSLINILFRSLWICCTQNAPTYLTSQIWTTSRLSKWHLGLKCFSFCPELSIWFSLFIYFYCCALDSFRTTTRPILHIFWGKLKVKVNFLLYMGHIRWAPKIRGCKTSQVKKRRNVLFW